MTWHSDRFLGFFFCAHWECNVNYIHLLKQPRPFWRYFSKIQGFWLWILQTVNQLIDTFFTVQSNIRHFENDDLFFFSWKRNFENFPKSNNIGFISLRRSCTIKQLVWRHMWNFKPAALSYCYKLFPTIWSTCVILFKIITSLFHSTCFFCPLFFRSPHFHI